MAGPINKLRGIQEPEESRGIAARLNDDARGPKNGSPASPNSRGDIARTLLANAGKNPKLSRKVAMADPTASLEGNQEPTLAEETRTSEARRTNYPREAKNGKKHGQALLKPRRTNTANKEMDDRVKKGDQFNAKERAVVCALVELGQGSWLPPPKRGAEMKGKARQGADQAMDQLLRDLPKAQKSETTTTLWDKPVWATKGKRNPRIRK